MLTKTPSKSANTKIFSIRNRAGIEKLSKSVSLFETAAKLQRDSVKQHSEGNFERAIKSANNARAIQLIAAEKFLSSLNRAK